MPATTPQECDALIGAALNSGDLEAAVALYEPDGAFVAQPGQIATGPALREALGAFIALKPSLQIEVTSVTTAGDLALLTSNWSLNGTGPDGSPLMLSGRGAEVVRRQADGTWRFVIDNPYGGED